MKNIALVGIGKIAVDQHVPALMASDDWALTATVSRVGTVDGVPAFTDFDAMLAAHSQISVISLCLPPVPRFAYAARAIAAGRHVMLEKPPGATLAEVQLLSTLAAQADVTLFATWHSRMARGVAAAKAFLSDKTITKVEITWHEDVRRWHPGQSWVFEPGGMGVFDPGINALSIMTEILPMPVYLQNAVLRVPENCQTPIQAELQFSNNVHASFDWLKQGDQQWDITVHTQSDEVTLLDGGNRCVMNGVPSTQTSLDEYPALYARMAQLIDEGQSDVDLSPMIHVADAMACGQREMVDPFHF